MTPEIENPSKLPVFFGILGIVVILVVAIVLALRGHATFFIVVKWIFIGLMCAGVVGLLIYAIWWLFSKQPNDAIFENQQRYLKACKMNAPDFPQTLYFRGSGEWEFKKIGRIVGVAQSKIKKTMIDKPILDEKGQQKYLLDGKGRKVKPLYESEELTEDIIAFKRKWLSSPQMVRVLRYERSSLNADKVFLFAMAFTPELFGFYYLPSRFRDKELIDRVIIDEIHRSTIQHFLKEEQNITDDAIAISPRHQKEMERTRYQMAQQSTAPASTGTGG